MPDPLASTTSSSPNPQLARAVCCRYMARLTRLFCRAVCFCNGLSRQIYAVPDLCCIVTWRLVESVGRVFDPLLSSAIAVFAHVKDELAVIPCLLVATL